MAPSFQPKPKDATGIQFAFVPAKFVPDPEVTSDPIGQRNILAHEYGQIDHELLYKTATEDVPELIALLERRLQAV